MRSLEDTCETVSRKIVEKKNCFSEIMTEFKNIIDCFDNFRKSNRVLLLGIANGDKIENLVEVRKNYSFLRLKMIMSEWVHNSTSYLRY